MLTSKAISNPLWQTLSKSAPAHSSSRTTRCSRTDAPVLAALNRASCCTRNLRPTRIRRRGRPHELWRQYARSILPIGRLRRPVFSRVRSQPICHFCSRPSSNSLSTSRPPRHWASACRRPSSRPRRRGDRIAMRCRLLAQSRHEWATAECPLSGNSRHLRRLHIPQSRASAKIGHCFLLRPV